MNSDDNLKATIGGKWVKTKINGTMLIEVKDDVLLGVSPSIGVAQIGIRDEDGIYQYVGDVTFTSESVRVYSPAITEIAINGMNVAFPNYSADMTDLKVSLDIAQKKKWNERFMEPEEPID